MSRSFHVTFLEMSDKTKIRGRNDDDDDDDESFNRKTCLYMSPQTPLKDSQTL